MIMTVSHFKDVVDSAHVSAITTLPCDIPFRSRLSLEDWTRMTID